MKFLKKTVLPILLATIWISLSEYIRNEFLVKSYWTEHYKSLGLVFPSEPLNGAIWGIWSLLFAVVIGNLEVLPFGLLYIAVPLSLLEAFLAALIVKKLSANSEKQA
jgi:hypothetical protein